MVWNWVWIKHPWALISQLSFESCYSMCLQVFFQKLAQEDWKLCFWTRFLAWRCNLGFPDFALPLERGKWRSSVKSEHPASLCSVLQSARAEDWALERSHVSPLEWESSVRRAEISPIQYFYSTLERDIWRPSVNLCCLTARAVKPELERDSVFLKTPETVFWSHLCILISS